MKYVEEGTNYSHSVGYEYDKINNLSTLVETINGVKRQTSYSNNKLRRSLWLRPFCHFPRGQISAIIEKNLSSEVVYAFFTD